MLQRKWRNWLTLLVRMENSAATLQNSLATSLETKHATMKQPRNYTLGHLSQRNEDLGSHKNLSMHVQSSFIRNLPHWKQPVSFSGK